MDNLFKDLRFAARSLRKRPGWTLIAIGTLALGIGANTAIFSLLYAVLLRPLPYPEPEGLVSPAELSNGRRVTASYRSFVTWRDEVGAFEALAAFEARSFNLEEGDAAQRIRGARVSADYFEVMGMRPLIGRAFLPEEATPGADPVTVLNQSLWQQTFGSDPDIVGKSIRLEGTRYTVVGVMPTGLRNSRIGWLDMWSPLVIENEAEVLGSDARWLGLTARLAPGVSVERALTEVRAVQGRIVEEFPMTHASYDATVTPLREVVVGRAADRLLVLFVAVTLVLFVACVNVANLLLARAVGRQEEILLRSALGASRGRLAAQLTTEGLLLAGLSALVAIPFAKAVLPLVLRYNPRALPAGTRVDLDLNVLGFTVLLALLIGFLFSLAPAFAASKLDLAGALRRGKSTGDRSRGLTRGALVIAEVALTLMVLAGLGLVLKSYLHLSAKHPGFEPKGLLTFQLSLPEQKYAEPFQTRTAYLSLNQQLANLPGVVTAGSVDYLPLESGWVWPIYIEGQPILPPGEMDQVFRKSVTPGFFETLGIPILSGRDFTEQEIRQGRPVIIVDQLIAEKYWPGQEALGKRIMHLPEGEEWQTVIGIVGNVSHLSLVRGAQAGTYVPLRDTRSMNVALRGAGTPESLISLVRQQVRQLDASLPLSRIRTGEEVLLEDVATQRFNMMMLGAFAVLALVLATVGIYGVISASVAQRQREMGIRIALGAHRLDLVRSVLLGAFKIILAGVVCGWLAGALSSRLIASMLHEVEATDPTTLALVSATLVLVGLLAAAVPALRAARVDPISVIRNE